ncbi:MAG TPA: hypothetical protein VLK82_05905 [Candidatus Tectomicrobia bacterium]|nr:hypothetical protein [Candidatus Tectomicrobia bacterium]
MIDLAREGRWLQVCLPDQRAGWIMARYAGRTIPSSPPAVTPDERTVWTSAEDCQQVVTGGGRSVGRRDHPPAHRPAEMIGGYRLSQGWGGCRVSGRERARVGGTGR